VNEILFPLLVSAILAGMAGWLGVMSVRNGDRSRWTVVWMLLGFVAQCVVLAERGEVRGQCPLGDAGEILVFLAWSLTLFYLVIGSTYRLSLLGVFTSSGYFWSNVYGFESISERAFYAW